MLKKSGLPYLSLVALTLSVAPVLASGYISMPDTQEMLPNFGACLARLDAAYVEDGKAIAARTVAVDGRSREVSLESRTNGVERSERNKARYHGRIWYAHGRISSHGAKQREVSHSWQEQELVCNGRKLTIRRAKGYTLSTFEPVSTDSEQ